jgi:hypothetical protein
MPINLTAQPKFEQRDPTALLGFLERVCESKVSYPSLSAAWGRRDRLMARGRRCVAKTVAGCEAYRCRFCGEFHLGHPKPGFERLEAVR